MGGSMIQLSSWPRPARNSAARCGAAILLLLVACCLSLSAAAQNAGNPATKALAGFGLQKPAPAKPSPSPAPEAATAAPAAIPLPDVASRAEDLNRMLRGIADQMPTDEQLDAMKATLDERGEILQAKQKEVEAMLAAGTLSALEFHELLTYWRGAEKECAESRPQLLDWANAAQSATQQLQAQQPQWTATLDQNKATPGLGPVLDLIRQQVREIQELQTKAQNQLRLIVNLQVRAANQDQLALEVIDRLAKASARLEERLLQRDSPPLWQVSLRRQQGESANLLSAAKARWIGIRAFASENGGMLVGLLIFCVLSLFGAYRLHIATRQLHPADDQQAQALCVARHWFALGLLPALLFGYALAPSAPVSLISLTVLVSFLPILVLLPPLIDSQFRAPLYWVAALYAINASLSWLSFFPAYIRGIRVFSNLALVVIFAILLRRSRISPEKQVARPRRILVLAMQLAVGIVLIALVANVFGYVKLAQYMGVAVFYSAFVALSVVTGVSVFTLLLEQGINTPAAQQLAAVRMHREGIARWTPRLLKWGGVLLWLGATLELLGIRARANALVSSVLDFHIAGGSANITLGAVLGVFVILLLGYAISSALRFILREDLLKRFHMARGLPELISSTLHYLFLVLVFLFAVSAGGIELNKFTVLTGAFGIGVGFGMQNIVNNFVSGLILQFERPIHIGDVLEIDGATGKVTRIGIRSSTILTFQGSEVIIPNANFISGKVINWTLTEAKRRVDLPVGVAYGSDPKLVKELLERPAVQHSDVLTSPEPAVFFKEFGDSGLNFELQFWVMKESNTVKVKSEVALEVMRLLDEAGIEIPFPQRDLRLRSVDDQAAAALSGDGTEREDIHARIRSTG